MDGALWGGGEARSTEEAGSCRWREGALVQGWRGSGNVREIGATFLNSVDVRELRKAPHSEAKGEPGRWSRELLSPQVVALAVGEQSSRPEYAGVPRPGRLVGWLLATFRVRRRDALSESRMR